jgi:hypothetical protein
LPITDVVKLLEAMQKDLEKEAREDEKTWEKLQCWCSKNKADKTKAVDDAQSRLEELQTTIETSSAKMGSLKTSIEQAKKDIEEGTRSLAEAVEMRKKDAAAFHDQERDLMTSVKLLDGAITALSKHHPAMLQSEDGAELAKMRPALRSMVHQHLSLLGFLRSSPNKDEFLQFIDAQPEILDADGEDPLLHADAFLQGSRRGLRSSLPFKSYAPQSGQVIGLLKQMKDSFGEDIPQIQSAEQSKVKAFSQMKAAKESELQELGEAVEAHTQEYVANKEALADAKYDVKDTKASLDADQRFMLEIIEKCTNAEHEYPQRAKLRQDEITAVSEAVAILSTDAVRDGQQTAFGFLQLESHSGAVLVRRARAVAVLEKAAQQAPVLALILAQARSDPFPKVIAAIDKLVQKLDVQQADEVKERDFCIDELHQNEVQNARKTAESEGLGAKIADLDATSKALADQLKTIHTEIHDMQVELQRATNARKEENIEYQRVVGDQRTARQALEAAHEKLQGFYAKRQNLLQADAEIPNQLHYDQKAREEAGSAPEFQDHQPHKNANSVLTLLKKIAGDTKVLEDESVHNEQQAQASYEMLVKGTNDSVKAKSRLITDKMGEKASVDQAKGSTEAGKSNVDETVKDLSESLVAIHQQCSFLLSNFDARQEARSAEMDALAEVKATLKGMKA